MALPAPTSDASLPIGLLKTLYPLACLLVGPEEASELLLHVYQQTAERPPAEHPDDREEWLRALLRAAGDEAGLAEAETASALEPTLSSSDSLRQEVAERIADETLPVALAACSPQERFLLALGALSESEDPPPIADALDTTPSDARATLWTRLRSVLSKPEFALVDETLSDAFLQDAVRDWIEARFSPVPRSLQTQIQEILRTARTSDSAAETDDPSSAEETSSLLDRLLVRPTPRALLIATLIGAAVLGGSIGVSYLRESPSPSSSSSPSLVAFSAERAGAIRPDLTTSSRSKAEAYVESTWNRQIQLPAIKGARVQGVGQVRPAEDVEIPVLLYADTSDNARIATFAYSYALADRIEDTATLDTEIRDALARRNRLVSNEQAGARGLLWRDRDDIFVAIAPSLPPDSLRSRLRP